MSGHTKLILRELLPRAKIFVAEAARRLAAQEARVADLQRKGRDAPQSKKLARSCRKRWPCNKSRKYAGTRSSSRSGIQKSQCFGLRQSGNPHQGLNRMEDWEAIEHIRTAIADIERLRADTLQLLHESSALLDQIDRINKPLISLPAAKEQRSVPRLGFGHAVLES
jgi:hypothetical protein